MENSFWWWNTSDRPWLSLSSERAIQCFFGGTGTTIGWRTTYRLSCDYYIRPLRWLLCNSHHLTLSSPAAFDIGSSIWPSSTPSSTFCPKLSSSTIQLWGRRRSAGTDPLVHHTSGRCGKHRDRKMGEHLRLAYRCKLGASARRCIMVHLVLSN